MKFSIRITSKISTRIILGDEALRQLGAFLHQPSLRNSRPFVLADPQTRKFCLPVLLDQVPVLKGATVLETEGGEQSKTLTSAIRLWQLLLHERADKNALIINLGGGVISDLGGYLAAGFQRGIRYLNVPTSLMGMADAAIGGKTAINLDQIKNQIGHFYPPEAVFIYPGFLATLPAEHMRSGIAEIFKSILLGEFRLWRKYKSRSVNAILEQPWTDPAWKELLLHSVRYKTTLVRRDPYERDLRKALNFGHTIGHALESLMFSRKQESITHGDAVAAGMVGAAYLSTIRAGLPEEDLREIRRFILNGFQPVPINQEDIPSILDIMQHDKKNRDGQFRFTLISAPGSFRINQSCTASEVKQALISYIDGLKTDHEIISDK